MKKISFLLLICIVATGCQIWMPDLTIPEDFDTLDEAWIWVSTELEYMEQSDWWHPAKVYQEGGGSCMGFSTLFAYFARDLGYEPEIVLWHAANHSLVKIDGVLYEPQVYGMYYIYLEGGYTTVSLEYVEKIGRMPNGL